MPTPLHMRSATDADAAACSKIYAPYVIGTCISFEVEPPTPVQFEERISDAQVSHEWLVAECEGKVVGYAYGHQFNERSAYRWSVETSIYLAQDQQCQGIGRSLYELLLTRLGEQGYRRAFAGITLPNDASIGLHRSLGFDDAGCYRRVGWKHGAWRDVAWMQRDLQSDGIDPPPNPFARR